MLRLILFALAMTLVGPTAYAEQTVAGLLVKQSAHSFADTVTRFETVVKDRNLTIFAKIDHAAGAAGVGQDLRPTTLFIFGTPRVGAPLMQAGQTVGIDLPMKALVYQDADGAVFVATNDPASLAERHHLEGVDQVLSRVSGALAGITQAATE